MKKTLSKIIMASIVLLFPATASAQLIRGGIRVMGNVESYSITATSTANATSTISKGLNVRQTFASSTETTTLWVVGLGSCTEALETNADGKVVCGTDAGGSIDLQDAYNSTGADAQITTADAKDVIVWLQDTATDPIFAVYADPEAQTGLRIGTATGAATTTTGVWENYGRLGIGTTSPGTAFAVQATSTLLGGGAYVYGQLNAADIVATSTINVFGGASATLSLREANSGGLTATDGFRIYIDASEVTLQNFENIPLWISTNNITRIYIAEDGDVGIGTSTPGPKLDVAGFGNVKGNWNISATSTASSFYATSTLSVASSSPNGYAFSVVGASVFGGGNVNIVNNIDVQGTATNTFDGSLSIGTNGLLVTSGGLRVDVGDVVLDQKLVVDGTASSTFAGGLQVTGAIGTAGIISSTNTGTSSFDGHVDIDGDVLSGGAVVGGYRVLAANATMNIECDGNLTVEFPVTSDVAINYKNCWGGQKLTIRAFVGEGGDFQPDWNGITASSSEHGIGTTTAPFFVQDRENYCQVSFASGTVAVYSNVICNSVSNPF